MIRLIQNLSEYGQGSSAYTISVPAESISQSYPVSINESIPPISISAQKQFNIVDNTASSSAFSLSSLFGGNNKYLLMGIGALLLLRYIIK